MESEIKKIRCNQNMTQTALADYLGIPIKTLRNWEQNIRKPNQWTYDLVMEKILNYQKDMKTHYSEVNGILPYTKIKNIVGKIARQYDIKKMYLFGSYAEGTAQDTSDIDLYMESDISGLLYFEIAESLRELLKKKVDLLSNNTILEHSKIELEIKKTGILIYERS